MRRKVLIVEDTRDISDALLQLMELRGYDAVAACGGFEGLRLARQHQPDLVVLDLSMPDLNGEQVVAELRADPDFSGTPILCVSSFTEGRKAELLEAGFTEVFSKTSFIRSFAPTLKKYLSGG
jgi:DNA-binding response OmpR family regulator